eukprot:CAMPEP_0174231712 /NCGR_PEP_ID=MMETSP0417-20130205/2173_1 /TAXON_ID=242541 /ORGANISM="Mayorella sp, Strain BSH-02190019" /LENGTH=490 /DNA_ID=CAMNT_0015309641 /DNA_START=119 /DNA_END=1591 /DNA_ORIENTATION=+
MDTSQSSAQQPPPSPPPGAGAGDRAETPLLPVEYSADEETHIEELIASRFFSSGAPPPCVCIVGAGLVGRGWAVVFSRAGLRVHCYESYGPALASAPALLRHTAQAYFADAVSVPIEHADHQRRVAAAVDDLMSRVRFFGPHGAVSSGSSSRVVGSDGATKDEKVAVEVDEKKDEEENEDVSGLCAALCGCVYVQECVPERLELKQRVLALLGRLSSSPASSSSASTESVSVLPDASQPWSQIVLRSGRLLCLPVVASSSSNLVTADLVSDPTQSDTQSVADPTTTTTTTQTSSSCGSSGSPASSASSSWKSRVLVAHPVNPPHVIPLVELLPGPETSPLSVLFARSLLRHVRQRPILLRKALPGFCLNRLQYALLREAFYLVEEGVVSPEDVDSAVCDGLGLRWCFMGPCETIDLNAPGGVQDYFDRYGDGLHSVASTAQAQRRWTPDTEARIHQAMRTRHPLDSLPQRAQWRDRRLVALLKHKAQQPL